MESLEQSLVAFNFSIAKLAQHTFLVVKAVCLFAYISDVVALTHNDQTVCC